MKLVLRYSDGMTLIEMLVAVIFLTLIGHSVWSMSQTVRLVSDRGWRTTKVSNTSVAIEVALRETLGQAGAGMLAMPNLAGFHVSTAEIEGTARDTVTALLPRAGAMRVASEPCPTELGRCFAVVGARAAEIGTGDVLIVGSPGTGGLLVQVTSPPTTFQAPCGADCFNAISCTLEHPLESSPGTHLHVTAADYGEGPVPGETCSQPFTLDGICTEVIEPAVFQRELSSCSPDMKLKIFTAVVFEDRTGTVAAEMAPAPQLVSTGTAPQIRAQPVLPVRFWIDSVSGVPTLMRQTGWAPTGLWNRAVAIAAPVHSLSAETLHAGSKEWVRGSGVTPEMLLPDSDNVRRRTVPGERSAPAREYMQSFATISAARISYGLPTPGSTLADSLSIHSLIIDFSGNLEGASSGGPG